MLVLVVFRILLEHHQHLLHATGMVIVKVNWDFVQGIIIQWQFNSNCKMYNDFKCVGQLLYVNGMTSI